MLSDISNWGDKVIRRYSDLSPLAHKLLCHLVAALSLFLKEVPLVVPMMSWLMLFQGVITLDVKKFLVLEQTEGPINTVTSGV